MRKLFMMAVLAACMVAQAQETDKQSVCCNETQKTCCENQKGCQHKVCCKDSVQKKGSYDHYKKVDYLDLDVAYGWNILTNTSDGMKSRFFRSREFLIGLRYKYTPKKALQTYSVGLWAKWSRYAQDDRMFVKDNNSVVSVSDFPTGTSSRRSCINIFSLSIPFFFTQKFGHKSDWSVTLGPVLNINMRGRINNEYEVGDEDFDINTKGIKYRPVTVDLMGMVTYKRVSIFCKYSPMTVLKKDMGPQFHAVTLGVFL